jgi:sulfoxide reductase heme-binding subunit YedZ
MTRILNSIPLLYVLLLLPGWLSIWDLFDGSWYYPQMMKESGELSVWYLIASLSVTPILLIINRMNRGRKIGIWLLRRRKHIGLMSFVFAATHVAHYIREIGDLPSIWVEAFDIELAVGWLGFIVLLALALTSNKASTRVLGRYWKPLHRLTYVGTGLIFLHWLLFDQFIAQFKICVAVLLVIKLAHIGLRGLPAKKRTQQPNA